MMLKAEALNMLFNHFYSDLAIMSIDGQNLASH